MGWIVNVMLSKIANIKLLGSFKYGFSGLWRLAFRERCDKKDVGNVVKCRMKKGNN